MLECVIMLRGNFCISYRNNANLCLNLSHNKTMKNDEVNKRINKEGGYYERICKTKR